MVDHASLSNDNRNYDYSRLSLHTRPEYEIIANMIEVDSKVIDFGCGDGSLLDQLIKNKNVTGLGYEISQSGVEKCREKGIKAVCKRIDEFHPELMTREFDYSICNVTIQMVMYPEILLKEMVRISQYQIVSFPNFAYISNRFDLLLNGRMPRPMLYNYNWCSTGHIHQLSILDFIELVRDLGGLEIIQQVGVPSQRFMLRNLLAPLAPNLLEKIPIFY
jgi:methionine biosynthesis protein MetW